MKGQTPVFALPGNPVSTMLTFEEFVAPALRKMMGHARVLKPLFTAELQQDFKKANGRTQLARVQVEYRNGTFLASSSGRQDTSYLKTLLNANAIAVLPAERTTFVKGDTVLVHLFDIEDGTDVFCMTAGSGVAPSKVSKVDCAIVGAHTQVMNSDLSILI